MCNNEVVQLNFDGARISLARPLHSLSDEDVAGLVAGLVHLKGDWTAERFEDCDAEVCLMLARRCANSDALAFSIDRDSTGLRLTAWRGDTHGLLGLFAHARDAFGFMWKLIEAESSETVHDNHGTFSHAWPIIVAGSAASPN